MSFLNQTTLTASSKPRPRCMPWLTVLSISASEPISAHPLARPHLSASWYSCPGYSPLQRALNLTLSVAHRANVQKGGAWNPRKNDAVPECSAGSTDLLGHLCNAAGTGSVAVSTGGDIASLASQNVGYANCHWDRKGHETAPENLTVPLAQRSTPR